MSVTVVMPSRGRPDRALAAARALRSTAAVVGTGLVVVVDADDPTRADYERALRFPTYGPEVSLVTLSGEWTGNLVRATNTVATRIADAEPDAVIGNLGDDHLCRTPGWDREILAALRTPGIAYGDDLLQGELLPTAPFVSAAIVNALGWYFLPTLEHMYVDNALKDLAFSAGILHYLPGVVIEHMHPGAGKAGMDPGYLRADTSTEDDRLRWQKWHSSGQFAKDLATVRSVLAVAA